MNDTDIAWAAGFFEGEGGLALGENRAGFRGRITCSQKHLEPLTELKRLFNGVVYVRKNPMGNLQGSWELSSKTAVPFLKAILPYIKTKKRRREIIVYMHFWNTQDRDERSRMCAWWKTRLQTELEEDGTAKDSDV